MIHTVHLDDNYVNIKDLLQTIRCQEQGVRFEKPFSNHLPAPEGYMTSDEFRKRATTKVNLFCDKHGIL
jgi:hypothetical protein